MLDERLIRADSTKLDELREIMRAQEHAERLHDIEMKDIVIEHGAAKKICEAVRALTDGKNVLMVTGPTEIVDIRGENVKEAVKGLLEKEFHVEWLVIEEGESIVHATPENAAKIQARIEGKDIIVGVGSGTICDLCKYASHYYDGGSSLPIVIVQTALSVNAFSDNSSVMLFSGVKRTVHSRYPDILLIDLDVVTAAPAEMNVSGYGDLIATWTAPVDWYLANILGMGDNFHTAPSDMIRTQCSELLEDSELLKAGDSETIGRLANALTLSGLAMGLANESSPASGSEHVMSHLIDMTAAVRGAGICYHGTQVAVSGIISGLIWDYLLHDFDPAAVKPELCYPAPEEMEKRVRAAFDWLDEAHSASEECWRDYRQKLDRWYANRDAFRSFLANFEDFKRTVAPWVKDPAYVASCMHKAGAPCRYSELNYPVDAETAVWAITNCHLMRKRFSVIDLLNYCGIWDDAFVKRLIKRASDLDAGL